jgi:DNA invertase Pin-like site-specific DNA recombinase
MKITEIIEILRNDNTSYLWDLPKPKWEAIDYYNLNQIKQGNDYKNKKKVLDFVELSEYTLKKQQEQSQSMKRIIRKSDGTIFYGINQCSRETGINRTSLSNALNKSPRAFQKYVDEFEFINN